MLYHRGEAYADQSSELWFGILLAPTLGFLSQMEGFPAGYEYRQEYSQAWHLNCYPILPFLYDI